jgi:hypothetical protein
VHSLWGTGDNHENLRIGSVRAEIWRWDHILNASSSAPLPLHARARTHIHTHSLAPLVFVAIRAALNCKCLLFYNLWHLWSMCVYCLCLLWWSSSNDIPMSVGPSKRRHNMSITNIVSYSDAIDAKTGLVKWICMCVCIYVLSEFCLPKHSSGN